MFGILLASSLFSPRATIEKDVVSQIPADHFFPRTAIYAFLDRYSEDDLEKVLADYQFLYKETFSGAEKKRIYLLTCGGPGAGKSTILENHLEQSAVQYAYIDPDRSCLQKMPATYIKDVEEGSSSEEAYTKWRDASNFISNTLMAIALDQGFAIAHGTTMTSPKAALALSAIKEKYGYERHLLHITCPDVVRISSDRARQVVLFQCTEDDLIDKGKWFFDRYEDYLKHTDQISFFFRPAMDQVILAAKKENETITIINQEAWDSIQALHQR